ncbi:hypothetical protein ACFQ7N_39395, partial [Streptomyces niveus]
MVSNHGKKQRAKKQAQRTGAAYSSAAAGTTHTHEPLPDMTALPLVPHGSWRLLDLDLAARLVAACRAGCVPCQKSLAKKMVTDARPTLAALAGAVYGTLPTPGAVASGPTRLWAQLAREAVRSRSGESAFAAVVAMNGTDASALLEDALVHWAAGDLRLGQLVHLAPADPMGALREAGIEVVTLDDLDLGDDVDPYQLAPAYGVMPMRTATPGGPVPMLLLYPETEDAGIEDLESRTDWERWGLRGMPNMAPAWRLRARIADRSLQGLVHVGPDGEDAVELWRASESVTMPQDWWDLLDRAQH